MKNTTSAAGTIGAIEAVRSPPFRTGMERIRTPVLHRGTKEFAVLVARDVGRMRTMIEKGGLRQAE